MEKLTITVLEKTEGKCNITLLPENEDSKESEKVTVSRLYSALINEINSMSETKKKTRKVKKGE